MLNWVRFRRSLSLRRFLCPHKQTPQKCWSQIPAGRVQSSEFSWTAYLSEPHAVPLVGRLLRLGRVHQLEAGLVLLMKVGVLAAATELRGIFIWRAKKMIDGESAKSLSSIRRKNSIAMNPCSCGLTGVSLVLVSGSGPISNLGKGEST